MVTQGLTLAPRSCLDSEGGLTPSRLRSAAEAVAQESADREQFARVEKARSQSDTFSADTAEEILRHFHLVRIVDLVEFVAWWHIIEEWLVEHPAVWGRHLPTDMDKPDYTQCCVRSS